MNRFVGSKFFPIAGALAVAALLTFPYGLMRAFRPPETSFSLFGVTRDVDQSFYAGRVGGPGIAFADSPRLFLTDAAGFWVLRGLHALTRDMDRTWVLARGALAFVWTLLLFALLSGATGARRASMAAAAAIVLLGDLAFVAVRWGQPPWTGLGAAFAAVSKTGGAGNLYLGPTRLLSPGFSVAALLAAGCLAVRAASGKGGRLGWFWAGLAAGALAYAHTDAWSVGLAALTGTAAWAAWGRRSFAPLIAVVVALAVSAPWIAVLTVLDADFLLRIKAVWTNAPEPDALVFLILGFLALAAMSLSPFTGRGEGEGRQRRESARPVLAWLGSGLIGAAVGMNAQVLTGIAVQPFHWALVGAFLTAVLAALALCLRAAEGRRWETALAVLMALGLARGAAYARSEAGTLLQHAQMREALAWIRVHAAGATVSALSPEAALTLPVYAGARTLAACDSPVVADLTAHENAVRLAHGVRLLGGDRDRFLLTVLAASPRTYDDTPHGPGEEWRITVGAEKVLFPYVFFSEYPRSRLTPLLKGVWAEAGRREYRVDLVWVGPFEREVLGGREPALGEAMFKNAWISIYKAPSGPLTRPPATLSRRRERDKG